MKELTYCGSSLFAGGPGQICMEEFDNDDNCSLDISDLTFFIDFMFGGGPVSCGLPPLPVIGETHTNKKPSGGKT